MVVVTRLSERTPFFVGLSLGIAISLIVLPILEDRCFSSVPRRPRTPAQRSPLSDDYEPIINLQGSPEFNRAKETRLQQVRPRYFSTELGIREKLLIAIVTSSSSFHSHAVNLNKTLLGEFKSTKYFLAVKHESEKAGLLNLPNVDLIPHVQAESHISLLAFEIIAQKYIKDYDFLFITTDSTYIHMQKLLQLVSGFSANENIHMGVTIDSGVLPSFTQCYLYHGVLLSHSVVRQAASSLQRCHNFGTNEGDAFLSNCISMLTQVPCTSDSQGSEYISLELRKPFSLLDWPAIFKSTTIYPILEGNDFLLLHELVCHQHLKETYLEISNTNLSEPWPLGIEPPFRPLSRFHVLTWMYFNESHVLSIDGDEPITKSSGKPRYADLENAIESCKVWHQVHSDVPTALSLINGYTRVDPTRGVEYILNFRTNVTESHQRFIVFRPLCQSEMLPVPYVTEHTRIIILVPVTAKEVPDAVSFLERYESTCLKKQENTALVLILLYNATDPGKDSENDVFKDLKAVSLTYANKYRSTGAKLVWYSIRILKRGLAIFPVLDLVIRKLPSSSLILLCQVNAVMDSEYLNRVRMNTIAKSQVFFPIPFVQYNQKMSGEDPKGEFEVKKQSGIFDSQDYSHSSFYILDYVATRSLIEKEVPAASTERDLTKLVYYDNPVTLVNMFLKTASLHVMRAVEPQLKATYREPVCSVMFSAECQSSFKRTLGAKSHLAKFILLDKLKKDKSLSS